MQIYRKFTISFYVTSLQVLERCRFMVIIWLFDLLREVTDCHDRQILQQATEASIATTLFSRFEW